MDTLLKIIYNPVKAFRELKSREKFPVMSLILLLVVVIINNILLIPVTTKIYELTFTSMQIPMSEAQIETTMQMLHKIRYLTAASAVFTYIFMLVIYTLVVWVFTKIVKQSLSFQKCFELMIHCCFVIVIGNLANSFILYNQGIENINNMFEISLTGLNLFTSVESAGVVFYTFLSLINPFYIWFVVLLTIGLVVLAGMKPVKGFIISFIFWMLIITYSVVTVYFSYALMQSKGLIR
jgi:hypothetical protein